MNAKSARLTRLQGVASAVPTAVPAAPAAPPQAPVAPAVSVPSPAAPPPPQAAVPDEEQVRAIDLDFTGVSTSFEPMPVGNYPAVIDEATYHPHSKKSGQPYVKFVLKVTAPEAHEGRKHFHNCSLQPDALWKLAQLMEAVGMGIPEGAFTLDLDAMMGLPCTISLTMGTYGGKPKNEVSAVLPSGMAGAAPF